MIENIQDMASALNYTEDFLPVVDNWASCDLFNPPIFDKNQDEVLSRALIWLKSEYAYQIRFGIRMLIKYGLKEKYKPEYLQAVANINSSEYYVKMMIAWYFSVALVHRYDESIVYFRDRKLDSFVCNEAIQKARDSKRILPERKAYLCTLRQKTN